MADRRRRPVQLPLAVVMAAAGLAACNSSHSAVATTVVPPPPGCDTSRVTVVGASLDLSGPGAALGRDQLTGLELGVAKVNAGGGVWPRNSCLELMYKDNRGDKAIDTEATLDLVNVEKAVVVVGDFLGSSAKSYLGKLGIPAISLSDVESTFSPRLYPNTFPMTASMASQAFVIAKTLEKDKVTSVGVVVTDDVASRQGAARLASVSAADGFRIVGQAKVSPSGRGATAALERVRAAHPQVLVVLDDAGAVASVLSRRAAIGWSVPVIAGPDTTTSPVLARAGGHVGGVSAVVPVGAVETKGPAAAAALHFRKALLARLGTASLDGSIIPYAETYDAMTMMGNAINGAKGNTATDVTSFVQNANYQGVLAAYTYTAGFHTGVNAANQVVVPVSGLSDGLLAKPPASTASSASGD